jgi:hypothetical protein
MVDGKALQNTPNYHEDFGGDKGEPGTTVTMNGPPIMVDVHKCPQCGYSVKKQKPLK